LQARVSENQAIGHRPNHGVVASGAFGGGTAESVRSRPIQHVTTFLASHINTLNNFRAKAAA
jgi:hypothetical protein